MKLYDAVIVGGSYAGLSAGLQLARARRRVLVMDAGRRRNLTAATSHGFLGQDGRSPGVIADEARKELLAYPTVDWVPATAVQALVQGDTVRITTDEGECFGGSRLILATGVVDELPNIPGLVERWGKSVFHCPYCHGYELNQGQMPERQV